MGRDERRRRHTIQSLRFNPRAPCGARRGSTPTVHRLEGFNPRAPCGARHTACAVYLCAASVSIHAPRVGRDVFPEAFQTAVKQFQSTRPVWGATYAAVRAFALGDSFNPRAPCGARRTVLSLAGVGAGFQSTRPVWGATDYNPTESGDVDVSIHAPRVGRDRTRGWQRDDGAAVSIHAPRVGRD